MIKIVPTTSNTDAQVKLTERVEYLDDYQARLVLAFINELFGPVDLPAEEMEVAA